MLQQAIIGIGIICGICTVIILFIAAFDGYCNRNSNDDQ